MTCLSANQVNDGYNHCLGGFDEPQHCRNTYGLRFPHERFRCFDSDICISGYLICNRVTNCPHDDDEIFCENRGNMCNIKMLNHTDVDKAICLGTKMQIIPFSLKTSREYPRRRNVTSPRSTIEQHTKQSNIEHVFTSESDDSDWLWHCNHGLSVRHWLGDKNITEKCFCPPSYYGDRCQYQNQRVSFTAQLKTISQTTVYNVIVSLINENKDYQQIESYHQYTLIFNSGCNEIINGYLTYINRVNNSSTNYSVHFDVYNKTGLIHLGSWYYPVVFSFLPVYRLAVSIDLPLYTISIMRNCPGSCINGECIKYMNKEKYYCRCDFGWSGRRCDVSIDCNDCSNDSLCIGMFFNRSICVCPLHKGGLRCLLKLSKENTCENNGQLLILDDGINEFGVACLCPNDFYGTTCGLQYNKLDISIGDIQFSSVLLIYNTYTEPFRDIERFQFRVSAYKLKMFQRNFSIYFNNNPRMVFVRSDYSNYYLAVLRHSIEYNISTSIDSTRRCPLMNELVNPQILSWPVIRRLKFYHSICQTYFDLLCFLDEPYMCLCTIDEHHANCFQFSSTPPKCSRNIYCQNGGECLQDNIDCPSKIMCNCTDCFFGDRCQFQAKGIGLTLDDILRYEIRPNT